jgi:ubiquitin-activating enzyme E1-like protein
VPAAAPIKNNFNSGELSPLMLGRVDFERYASGLRVCKNHLPLLQGPVTRRPGTYVCDEVKDSTKATRTVAFKFSTISAFALEFGDLYLRFKKNRAPVYDLTLTITGIAQANPGVVTYTGTDPSNGDHVDVAGVVGMTEVNARRFKVSNVNVGANTFELEDVAGVDVNTTTFSAYSSGGTAKRVYTVTTTYLEADLFQLKFKQSADVLYIHHPDYPERQLSRLADSSWTLADTVFLDGPYLLENITATTLTPSAATGAGITLTASSVVGINDGAGFLVTDIGRLIRMKQGAVWGYVRVVGHTSTTVVTADVINTLTSTAAKTAWRLGFYSATTGYPSCATFYGDRLYRGGVPEIPERLDGSKVGDYDNLAPSDIDGTVTDASAVSFRLNSDDVQAIRWMMGTSNGIAVGTFEGEWLVNASTLNEAITPTNIHANQSTSWGSADVQPVKAGSSLLFVEAGGRRVREMNYLYYENVLQAIDATVLAEHITKGGYDPAEPDAGTSTVALSGLVEIAYQKKKLPLVWGVRRDGVLTSLLYSKDDKVMGWQRHVVGGWSDALHTVPACVESCCVIPASDGSYDECWLIVKRYMNGRVVRMNEFLTDLWEQGNAQEDAYFVDSGLTYDGVPATTIMGLFHLVGETVQVLVDGATHPDVVVSTTGTITLTRAGSVVHVGYSYQSDGQCLRFEAGSATGTAQGKLQRSHVVIFRLYDTLGLQVGRDFDHLVELTFRETDMPMGQTVPLFTGDKDDFTWDGDYTTENYVCWRFASPLPGTVVAIMPQLVTQDRG